MDDFDFDPFGEEWEDALDVFCAPLAKIPDQLIDITYIAETLWPRLKSRPIIEIRQASRLIAEGAAPHNVIRIMKLLPPGTPLERLVAAATMLDLNDGDNDNDTNHE